MWWLIRERLRQMLDGFFIVPQASITASSQLHQSGNIT